MKQKWDLQAVKDVLIIVGSVGTFLLFGVRLVQLPKTVEAQAAQLTDHEKRLQKIEDNFSEVHEIKEILLRRKNANYNE